MQACAIEPEVRYFRTSKSDLSRVVRSRPLVKGNEDAGYEGVLEAEGHLSDHISIVSLKIIYVDKTKLKYTTHGELLMYAFRQMTNASRFRRQQTPTPSFNH